jgi:HPr kinase/phosphorylase
MSHIPGTLLVVHRCGILLRGPSGTGKSDTALRLLRDGHQLVADDAVDVAVCAGQLTGRAPRQGRGMLCLRGPGVIDVDRHFGPEAVAASTRIDRVIELTPERRPADSHGDWALIRISGVPIPSLRLAPERPLAALVALIASEAQEMNASMDATPCG